MNKKISILLPVYNDETYIKKAVTSVLKNTYKNFELIIINDGSNDGSVEVIKEIIDPRIKLFNKSNSGLIESLNYGIEKCEAEIIMRMDGDDIIHHEKINHQLTQLLKSKNVLLGTSGYIINNSEKIISDIKLPLKHENIIKAQLNLSPSIIHASIMVYKDALLKIGKYDSKINVAEDYDLFLRLSRIGTLSNIPDKYYYVRKNNENVSYKKQSEQLINTLVSRIYYINNKSSVKMNNSFYEKFREKIEKDSLYNKTLNLYNRLNEIKIKSNASKFNTFIVQAYYVIKRIYFMKKLLSTFKS